jgi:putative methyltransferase (TIGR04325 family)
MNPKAILKSCLPPVLLDFAQAVLDYLRPAQMEYLPGGWPDKFRGWNVESVARIQRERWPKLLAALRSTAPLGIDPMGQGASGRHLSVWDLAGQNNLLAYAYVLGLAAQGRDRIAMLDWGGGVGYYYVLSKVLLPGLSLDYHCQDVPLLCEIGRENLPEATFWDEPDACFGRKYDLVFAGSSLWYEPDWRRGLRKMALSTERYLFINRMIFVEQTPSFVAIQRPAAHGYATEYPMWIINRGELLQAAAESGLSLVREFLISQGPRLHRAPEQGAFRGFLFKKS